MATVGCAGCGVPIMDEQALRRSQWRYGADLCLSCYQTSVREGVTMRFCRTCGTALDSSSNCPRCMVVDRVGAEMFECDCGVVVHMADSVRQLRRGTGRIERVCKECSPLSPCRAVDHTIATPTKPSWVAGDFPFQPYPDLLKPGYCTTCKLPMFWNGKRWSRMTWTVLAEMWEKADA